MMNIRIDAGQSKVKTKSYREKLKAIATELNLEPRGTIVIKLGGLEESRSLNRQYLEKDYPTDVLSFPFNEELPEGYYVGDIFICFPVAQNQAKENHIALEEELFRLMVHGLLHLYGYDHETDSGQMLSLQEQLVAAYLKREAPVEEI